MSGVWKNVGMTKMCQVNDGLSVVLLLDKGVRVTIGIPPKFARCALP